MGNPWLLPLSANMEKLQKAYGKKLFPFGGFCFPGLLFLDIQAGPDPVDLMKGGS